MATCRIVATTAPSHRAPKSEYSTVYLKAGPKSKGPAPDSCAIIQPPITNSTRPIANAMTYAGTGHQNRGLPYRQVSGSLPHMTEPIATPTPIMNGSGVEELGVDLRTLLGMSMKPLMTRYSTQRIMSGATMYRANAVIPVKPK